MKQSRSLTIYFVAYSTTRHVHKDHGEKNRLYKTGMDTGKQY